MRELKIIGVGRNESVVRTGSGGGSAPDTVPRLSSDGSESRLYQSRRPWKYSSAVKIFSAPSSGEAHANWYATPYDERKEMMYEHGASGRKFAGKIVQLVTGSTGLDDFEWGVTLFGTDLEVVKDVVYTLRYDKGSALYGEFGTFFVGYLAPIDEVV